MSAPAAPALTGHRPIEGSFEAYKREQSCIARKRLYPLTAFYTVYALVVAVAALRSRHPFVGILFYLAGIPVWTVVETHFIATSSTAGFPPRRRHHSSLSS